MFGSIPTGTAFGALITTMLAVAIILLATAVWVYRDSHASAKRGRPVISSVGSWQLNKPVAWFLACLFLFEMALPLYLRSRHPA